MLVPPRDTNAIKKQLRASIEAGGTAETRRQQAETMRLGARGRIEAKKVEIDPDQGADQCGQERQPRGRPAGTRCGAESGGAGNPPDGTAGGVAAVGNRAGNQTRRARRVHSEGFGGGATARRSAGRQTAEAGWRCHRGAAWIGLSASSKSRPWKLNGPRLRPASMWRIGKSW